MWLGVAAMVVGSLVVIAIGRRARSGGLPRNHVVGLRTEATLHSDASWDAAHVVAGGHVVLAGTGGLVAALGAAAIALAGASQGVVGAAIVLAAGLMVGLLVVGGVLGDRAARAVVAGERTRE